MKILKKFSELLRELRIRLYKHKRVRYDSLSFDKNYHLYFKLEIQGEQAEQVFDIVIPATGIYFARKKLKGFVHKNIKVNIVHFNSLEDEHRPSVQGNEVQT